MCINHGRGACRRQPGQPPTGVHAIRSLGLPASWYSRDAVAPVALAPAVENGVGFRVFGGSELTFASIPQFGLSADLGYRRFPTPFPGFETDPLSVSIAGHWYIR